MEDLGWLTIVGFVFLFGLASRKLDGVGLSPPLVFVGFGVLCGDYGLGLVSLGDKVVHTLAELTLMLVLFGDAARIELAALRREAGLPLRLLAIGMPLTIVLGGGLALLCFPQLSLWEAGLLGALLAPTDAALGQSVVSDKRVPLAVRQALNVESGLNDGIALPIVMVFAALAVGGAEHEGDPNWLLFWIEQIGLGPLAGVAVALAGGRVASWAIEHRWIGETFEGIAGLSLALLAYLVARLIGGNGFISAFVAGLVLGNQSRGFAITVHGFLETEGQLLMIAVFMLVGASWAYPTVVGAEPMMWFYALSSLTFVRMVPVALSLIGKGVRWPTGLFLGWFGPRGLATVLFALLVVEREQLASRELLFDVSMLTVILSVVAHGLSARPASSRYGRFAEAFSELAIERSEVVEHPTRVDHERIGG